MIYLIFAIISSAAMSIFLKVFRDQRGNRFGILLGNYATCVLVSWLLLPDRGRMFSCETLTLAFGIFTGFLFMFGLYMMQTCAAVNGAILTATFSKLGLLVPLTISILFLGERPGIVQYIAIAMVIASFFLIQPKEEGKTNVKPLVLLLTLAAVGSSDSGAKIFEHFGNREEGKLFFFFIFLTACIICFLLAVLEKRKTGKKMIGREVAAGFILGVPNYFSSYLLLAALNTMPGYMVYTIFSVGTILLVTAVSIPAFKEKLSARQTAGMAAILAALVMLNLRP